MRREHRRQRGGHDAGKAVQDHRQHQQTGKNQADHVAVNHHEGRDRQEEQRCAAQNDERTAAETVA